MPRMLIFLFKGGLRMKRLLEKICDDEFFFKFFSVLFGTMVYVSVIGGVIYLIMLLGKAIL